jgi:pyrroloquinoline quinone biosynthesis protein D
VSEAVELSGVPAIAPGFRFQWEPAQDAWVLLYPEGMVTLGGSAGEILKFCDGERTVEQVCIELENQFPGADLRADVLDFFREARERGWLHVG